MTQIVATITSHDKILHSAAMVLCLYKYWWRILFTFDIHKKILRNHYATTHGFKALCLIPSTKRLWISQTNITIMQLSGRNKYLIANIWSTYWISKFGFWLNMIGSVTTYKSPITGKLTFSGMTSLLTIAMK